MEKAVKLQPGNPVGHYSLATAYTRTGHKEDAQREFALQQQTSQRRAARERRIRSEGQVSRRRFLCGHWSPLQRTAFSRFAAASSASYPFEEVPASASQITWVHTAGKSPQKYLPETTGAGCAFLDYDNDGWMDIYLVNSGKCDFYDPNRPCAMRYITTIGTEPLPT